jgi:hypothetical protein
MAKPAEKKRVSAVEEVRREALMMEHHMHISQTKILNQ